MASQADFNMLKLGLEALAKQARASLAQLADASETVSLDQNRVGRLSRMDALQGQAMAKANLARQRQTFEQAQAALRRLESGDYGRCENCDEWIAQARLEADPLALLCIDCARKAD